MEKLKNNKRLYIIILIILTIIQIISIVYATSKREGYHMDEYYSHGLMNYEKAFIFDNEDFKNNWHTPEYFKNYLVVNENEKWNFSAVYNNQIEDVHPPLYYLLLRIACSFNINEFSIWPGTILNIILFIFSNVMLYLIGKSVFKNEKYSLLLCLLNGFSIATIEAVMYVRMYQLLILEVLIFIYWHLKNKDKVLNIKNLLPLYFIILIGGLTHYYYFIILAILYFVYIIENIKTKNFKNILKYTLTYVLSAISILVIFPYCINHIFVGYRGAGVISNAKNFIFLEYFIHLMANLQIMNEEIFNGYMPIILSIIVLSFIGMLIINYKNKAKLKKDNSNIKYILLPTIIYLIISIQISPYYDLRYIMPVVPLLLILVIYVFYFIINNITNKKSIFEYLLLALILLFGITLIPRLNDNSYSNKGNYVLNKIAENKPIIYLYNDTTAQYNKMMEIYSAFLYSNETYILPENEEITKEKIQEIIKDKDISNGIVLIRTKTAPENCINDIYNTGLFNNIFYIGKMNIFKFYILK